MGQLYTLTGSPSAEGNHISSFTVVIRYSQPAYTVDSDNRDSASPVGDTAAVQPHEPDLLPTTSEAPKLKAYGRQWKWVAAFNDYIFVADDGRQYVYTAFQKTRGNLAASEFTPPSQLISASPPQDDAQSEPENAERASDDEFIEIAPASPKAPRPKLLPAPIPKPYEGPLDWRFSTVGKPKRFYTIGRIFKTVWFEPYGEDSPVRQSDREWADTCTSKPFYGQLPVAKFRWFVVVRKRLNHSLCFSITTYAGPGTAKLRRGRAEDFVVLHLADIEPPAPNEEEKITRNPIGVIIEEEEQYISPLARLDCSRLYTVEDNLKAMKIGRVHTESLKDLEDYYKICVE